MIFQQASIRSWREKQMVQKSFRLNDGILMLLTLRRDGHQVMTEFSLPLPDF
jgi:hypothetical protein